MDLETKVKMSLAMMRHVQSCGLEPKSPMDWFTRDIDEELRSRSSSG